MTTSTDRSPTTPREHASMLLTRTRWSPEELALHQRGALDALLRHAVATSPFYRRTLGPDPVGASLDELPTLSKQALLTHFDDIITEPALRREEAADDTPARVRTRLHDALVAAGAAPPPIFVDVVTEIPREPGPGAKLKTVLVEPDQAH
jgi:hypothetical protein